MNRLKDLRQANGWTQAQLGEKIGLAKTTISGYESEAHYLDPPTICAICDLFGCTADYLLGRSDTPLPVISEEDAQLLEAYRAADPRDREFIDHLLRLDLPVKQKREIS